MKRLIAVMLLTVLAVAGLSQYEKVSDKGVTIAGPGGGGGGGNRHLS
ncbi:hypothetical protein [Bacillus sp. ISL-57]|nr:hypothetical protein [Bacillus sp. ISL-57]MBT2714718.1 hypothetical protein [Bacillus sp. ISL-57]